MPDYRIYCLDSAGRIWKAHAIECQGDAEALAEGESVCGEYGGEVWEGTRMVGGVNNQSTPIASRNRSP